MEEFNGAGTASGAATRRLLPIFCVIIAVIGATFLAAYGSLDMNGRYTFEFTYKGAVASHYTVDISSQSITATTTGYKWHVTQKLNPQSGESFHWVCAYDANGTSDRNAWSTTLHIRGVIDSNGAMHGTWSDNYQGGKRDGTWKTTAGYAKVTKTQEPPKKPTATPTKKPTTGPTTGPTKKQTTTPPVTGQQGYDGVYRGEFSGEVGPANEKTKGTVHIEISGNKVTGGFDGTTIHKKRTYLINGNLEGSIDQKGSLMCYSNSKSIHINFKGVVSKGTVSGTFEGTFGPVGASEEGLNEHRYGGKWSARK